MKKTKTKKIRFKRQKIKEAKQPFVEYRPMPDMSVEGIDKPINPEIDRRLRAGGL